MTRYLDLQHSERESEQSLPQRSGNSRYSFRRLLHASPRNWDSYRIAAGKLPAERRCGRQDKQRSQDRHGTS